MRGNENLYLWRDVRFMPSEAARAATLNLKSLTNWLARDIVVGVRKDARLNRWSFCANEVLQLRLMGELQQQAGMEPMHAAGIARHIAEVWYAYHVQLGNDGHLVCLLALNAGASPIFSFRPLPEQVPKSLAQKLGDDDARQEVISGVHLRVPIHHIAMDVQDRLRNILQETGE